MFIANGGRGMLLILIMIVLLEWLMFGRILWDFKNRNQRLLLGIILVCPFIIAEIISEKNLIWVCFVVEHEFLFSMYFVCCCNLLNKIEKKIAVLFTKYMKISTSFYIIPVVAVLYTLVKEVDDKDRVSVTVILVFDLVGFIYTLLENRRLDHVPCELFDQMEQEKLKQYIYRKNAIIAIYDILFSISMGVLYISAIDFVSDNKTVVIFILEFVFNLILYQKFCNKIKNKYMPEDALKYNKWQLIVPKRVGIGYTFNFSCPLTYVILGMLFIVAIVSLLHNNY